MNEPILIVLEGVPVAKQRPRFGNGRTYSAATTVAYETALAWQARIAMGSRTPLSGPLEVSVAAYLPIPKSWSKLKQESARLGRIRPTSKPDADNLGKCIDSCNKIIWLDDSQVVAMHIYKFYSDKPQLMIKVWSI